MKLAILSPLPPLKSGIADYVARTAEIYRSKFDVIFLTIQSVAPDLSSYDTEMDIRCFSKVDELEAWLESFQGKLLVHMGNNIFHLDYLYIIKKFSPFVIMHDFVMHHLFFEEYYLSSGLNGYKSAASDVISTPRSIDRINDGVLDEKIKFLDPLCEPIFEYASEVFLHSYSAINWSKLLGCSDNATYIPFIPPEKNYEVKISSDGKQQSEVKFAHFGHVTPPKQIESFLRLLKKLRQRGVNARLDCYGPCDDSYGFLLNSLSDMLGLSESFKIHGWQNEEAYLQALAESDFVVILRYPWAGETSAAAYDALSHGKKLIVLNYASFSELPGDGIIRIPLEEFLGGDYDAIADQINTGLSNVIPIKEREFQALRKERVEALSMIMTKRVFDS